MAEPARYLSVKICCIKTHDEARLALRAGADCLGFVSRMPNGPGMIDESLIADLVASLPPDKPACLLTSQRTPAVIADQLSRTRAHRVQLCDPLPPSQLATLRRALHPSIRIIQTIHVSGPQSLPDALAAAPHVDALLLDSGNLDRSPCCPITLGGTGRTHDWSLSRRIVDAVSVPVILAGGLNAANIARAIQTVRPAGVDVCSGVRTHDHLDLAKLHAFFRALAPFQKPAFLAPSST